MATPETWQDRVLVAIRRLADGIERTGERVATEVALRFADHFTHTDRGYLGLARVPQWQQQVTEAITALRAAGLVDRNAFAVTAAGRAAADQAEERLRTPRRPSPTRPRSGTWRWWPGSFRRRYAIRAPGSAPGSSSARTTRSR
ncbi:hypothetical protein [Paractinoplanes durhamensis]|uniref:hypothetical protein n=1 Tax=Paractinoplanes durhamensis TaxID=113563 RepID=UPI003632B88B